MLPLLVKEGKGGKRHIGFDCEVINQQNYLNLQKALVYMCSLFLHWRTWVGSPMKTRSSPTFPLSPLISSKVSTK
jgi:hypothetical protein